ncbi:AAA family ATPase [Sulfurimonas sp.]|uniref:AAA family ATPase n=1 Tax=Sulfurimonas sp. TaxID=2022749 RepID=UPI002AB14CE3|nr:AAA family ATPase [Sulfurimonas sp.]
MIERFYLKEYLSFKNVEIAPKSGLVVFTGPSGSGKSILMKSILSSLGADTCEASLCESSVTWDINNDEYSIENEDINTFKYIKKEKARYFINNQSISKKAILKLTSNYLRHLSLKDFSDFENENLISILDNRIQKNSHDIFSLKEEYKNTFFEYKKIKADLETLEKEEKKIEELKEFASYEITKIQEINPQISEDEELLKIKKELSKKEKILEKISLANSIFENEHFVSGALDALEVDSSFFDDSMNELRAMFESAEARFTALEDVNIEDVLNRIQEIAGLKKRYGSVEEAIKYKEQKIIELQKYENIEITKDKLIKEEKKLNKKVKELAVTLSKLRTKEIDAFSKDLNCYLKELYLRDAQVVLKDMEPTEYGKDEVSILLNNTQLQKISTGEFNRLRLGILVLKSKFMNADGGILMLDEIDANLSGEESMSVAKVLKQLSKHFQIFVVSHQPQLTSMGEQHFLIYKDKEESKVKELDFKQRVDEIARIISGEDISKEAISFAKELLEKNR